MSSGTAQVEAWFAHLGREPFAFQREAWAAFGDGKDGLIQAPTGMGKTLAAAAGPMIEAIDAGPSPKGKLGAPLTILWMTPLRALASDTVEAIRNAVEGLSLNWSVELRTSDTSSSVRRRQKDRLPTVLVTTPESLSLLLSYPGSTKRFESLRCAVADEWHELMGTKRGVQAELGLARLRRIVPTMRTWGISATLPNLDDALRALIGIESKRPSMIIRAPDDKPIELESVLPTTMERFPWAGHLGLRLVQDVAKRIDAARSTLVFTNTRSQSELWFRGLLDARPDWVGQIALHHGSLDRKLRQRVEQMLHAGELKAVVCTSSLDLGVDFFPVDQVIQIGSPKGIARAMQRAGRSGHQPGAISRLLCVPTHAFELVEFTAARWGIEHRTIEARQPVELALDVLAQHIVTIASGDGFDQQAMLAEVRSTRSFANLTDQHWQWVLDFAERGGQSLTAYPRFARIRSDAPGHWIAASDQVAKLHRLGIGTITADGSVMVQYQKGKFLGTVEESFVAKLRPGDTFVFAGRMLEFIRLYQMNAIVKAAKSRKGAVPRWNGGKLPLSSSLADAVRFRLDQAARGTFVDAEMNQVRTLLELQARWSAIPARHQILIEKLTTRDGFHHLLFPFQGRLVHEGLAALIVFRLSRLGHCPITATFNDYGIELLAAKDFEIPQPLWRTLLSTEQLVEDVLTCVNTGELARRHFREIARIAGLLVPTRPGAPKSVRQLQASSELFYDVFKEFDPQNLLLDQARREVLERQLEFSRLRQSLERIATEEFAITAAQRITPLAFPLWAERIASQQLRFENSVDRIERLARELEAAAEDSAALITEQSETTEPRPLPKRTRQRNRA